MGKTCFFGVLVLSSVAVQAERIELKSDYASCVVESVPGFKWVGSRTLDILHRGTGR